MDEKKILNFINDVILENGIEKELDLETIKKSIIDYIKYVKENGLGNKDVFRVLSRIEENVEAYIKLQKGFKKAGLPMLKIKMKEMKKEKNPDDIIEEGWPCIGKC